MQQNPTRDLQLDFNINEIKEKIDAVIKASTGSYQKLDKNDILNTYRIATVSGLLSGIMSITLKRIDDNKTEWKSEIMNAVGSNAASAVLARFQDEFLTILSKALAGEEINSELINKNKSGCLGVVLFLLALGGAVSYSIHSSL